MKLILLLLLATTAFATDFKITSKLEFIEYNNVIRLAYYESTTTYTSLTKCNDAVNSVNDKLTQLYTKFYVNPNNYLNVGVVYCIEVNKLNELIDVAREFNIYGK
jgi:hypothetical protein